MGAELWIPPRAKESFRKAPPPKLGEKFGAWSGPNTQYLTMPGGGVLQFDLSKLTLADFRSMRDHYQINASLSVLSFMMHRLDWHIDCTDKKIATFIEDNMRKVWTRLIRGLSQAYWAGYSPIVIQWENDLQQSKVVATKFKDLTPEECRVNWDFVDGYAPEGFLKPKMPIFDGILQSPYGFSGVGSIPEGGEREGIPRSGKFQIPVENCVHPNTLILCADLIWRKAGELRVGQKIIAFDENDKFRGRCYRTAEILVNNAGRKECVEVRTDIGDPILATLDHPFLVRQKGDRREREVGRMGRSECEECGSSLIYQGRGRRPIFCNSVCATKFHLARRKDEGLSYADHWRWVNAEDLKPGDQIGWFGNPDAWEYDEDRDAGWIAGMFDGEGCISADQLSISQNEGSVLQRLKETLARKGFDFYATSNTRDNCVQLTLRGGVREVARFLAVFRPTRLYEKFPSLLENVWIKIGKSVDLASVTYVERVGEQPIASIQTSNGTFVTQGGLSHNSLWYPLLMENGDYYGRKILRPAFPSWFFSILIHLFTNRYLERFGEPTPVGRADYEGDVSVGGEIVSGRAAMENILTALRNRSVVVLPSSRDPETKEYDYQIEYLESQMRGADFERYLGRLDEEMSVGIFTPMLLFRTADVGSYNLGVAHMQLFMWMLNALAGDLKEYIDKYVIDRLKVYNYGEKAPQAFWTPHQMGKENTETLRAIVTELIRGSKAKADLQELSDAIGITLEEDEPKAPLVAVGPDGKIPEPPTPIIAPPGGGAPPKPGADKRGIRGKPKSSGPKGVGQPRATGKSVAARLREQATKAYREGTPFFPILSHRKQFEEALQQEGWSAEDAHTIAAAMYYRLEEWLTEVAPVFTNADELVTAFEKVFDGELDYFADAI